LTVALSEMTEKQKTPATLRDSGQAVGGHYKVRSARFAR
jgi:hypothetical protein